MSNNEFTPEVGGNIPRAQYRDVVAEVDTFADKSRLNELLDVLFYQIDLLRRDLEEDLENFALLIDRESDERLYESHAHEWPGGDLGNPPDFIMYPYYKVLKLKSSTTAGYICKRYEEGVRDVTGTPSLDLLMLVDVMETEANLIKEFADVTIQRVDDSSEFRILESFQAWVQSGLMYAGQIRQIFQEKTEQEYSVREIERTTAQQARQQQAVSKVKLNSYNNRLTKTIEQLNINFSEFSSAFYNKHLKPAVDYRLSIGRKIYPAVSMAENEVEATSKILDDTVRLALADQHRRKETFDEKVGSILSDVSSRESARKSITELSSIGKSLPASGTKIMVPPGVAKQISASFYEEAEILQSSPPIAPDELGSEHSRLSGLFNNDHPQYLLRSGGIINGDIIFDEATIDGVVPSTHIHTGEDGSTKLGKGSIQDGILSDEMIDREDKPSVPYDLEALEFVYNSNTGTFDAIVTWTQDSDNMYEVQIAKIGA